MRDGVTLSVVKPYHRMAGVSGVRTTRGTANVLHRACSTGNEAQLRNGLLTSGKALLNAGDERRYTPFTVACASGHAGCVKLLLHVGADAALRNDVGLTGQELAQQMQRLEVLAVLTARDKAPTAAAHAEQMPVA